MSWKFRIFACWHILRGHEVSWYYCGEWVTSIFCKQCMKRYEA